MTAVKISGTISKDSRPDNGLEDIAEKIAADQFAQHVCIVVFEYHTANLPRGEAPIPTVRAVAIEPLDGQARGTAMELMNAARKARGQSALSGTLFDADSTDHAAQDEGPTTSRPADEWLVEPPASTQKRKRRTRGEPEPVGATEAYADELAAMKTDLGVAPTRCAVCDTEIHYDGAREQYVDGEGWTDGKTPEAHEHVPAER